MRRKLELNISLQVTSIKINIAAQPYAAPNNVTFFKIIEEA